jgi:hypothetical protein
VLAFLSVDTRSSRLDGAWCDWAYSHDHYAVIKLIRNMY